jgi:hypothetical protein
MIGVKRDSRRSHGFVHKLFARQNCQCRKPDYIWVNNNPSDPSDSGATLWYLLYWLWRLLGHEAFVNLLGAVILKDESDDQLNAEFDGGGSD